MAKRKLLPKRKGKILPKRKSKSPSKRDPFLAEIKAGFTKIYSLEKQKRSLYSRRYYWIKKLDALDPKQSPVTIRKKVRQINSEISAINKKLGVKGKILTKKAKKKIKVANVITEEVRVWDGTSRLTDALKTKRYKTIVFGHPVNKSFPSRYIVKIVNALIKLSGSAYKLRGGTPFLTFEFDIPNKTLTINIY